MLNNKYNYKKIERVTKKTGRHYETGCSRPLPSVTTILSATGEKFHLEEWRQRVGPDEAERITNEAAVLGEALHLNLENYILHKPERVGSALAKMMANQIIKKGLSKVDEYWGVEAPLYYPSLYAGTADVIAVHEGEPAILDFKNSRRHKKREWLEDYFCQLVAYACAHNALHNTKIKKGVIMMMVRDGSYVEYILRDEEFEKYEKIWFDRLYKYYEVHGIG